MKNNQKHNLNKICPLCGKEYQVRRESELNQRVYCSKQCQMNSFKKEKVLVNCKLCNKEIFVPPCLSKSTTYCSRKCKGLARRITQDPNLRRCIRCKEFKNIELDFASAGKNKPSYMCKICASARSAKRQRTIRGRFITSKSIAKRRKLLWEITEEQYTQLIENNCVYCNRKLNETGVGLDRKDNSVGYTIENVVPCCKLCNATKLDNFNYQEMLLLSEVIKVILDKREQW